MEGIIGDTLSDTQIAVAAARQELARRTGGDEGAARCQFAYALIRSAHNPDIEYGINLLDSQYFNCDEDNRRNHLYHMAIGHARLEKYSLALDISEHLLQFEPYDAQAKQLRDYIRNKLMHDDLARTIITGGIGVTVGIVCGIFIGIGFSLFRK